MKKSLLAISLSVISAFVLFVYADNQRWEDVNPNTLVDTEALPAVSRMYAQMTASNVWFVVTNYDSKVNPPALQLWERRDNADVKVFDALFLHDLTLTKSMDFTTNAIGIFAKTVPLPSWSLYYSYSGKFAPENQTWVTTPTFVLSGGYEFEKHITTKGNIFLLHNNGLAQIDNNETNGLTITDLQGNNILQITTAETQILGAQAQKVYTMANTLIVEYNVESATPPKFYTALELGNPTKWYAEDDPNNPCTITWSGQSGAWVVAATPKTDTDKCFGYATYEIEGGSVMKLHDTVLEASGGIKSVEGNLIYPHTDAAGNVTWTTSKEPIR